MSSSYWSLQNQFVGSNHTQTYKIHNSHLRKHIVDKELQVINAYLFIDSVNSLENHPEVLRPSLTSYNNTHYLMHSYKITKNPSNHGMDP